jgi:Ran GTPase-activating protein (RanGAP) involved in mRNA processing and transport
MIPAHPSPSPTPAAHGQAREAPIEVLDLGNSLTSESSDVLARLLFNKPNLRDVNLYMNELGNDGAARLAPALAACK